MKLHLTKKLTAALLALLCAGGGGGAYAATTWTVTKDSSGNVVFSTTQSGAYDLNLGAAANNTNKDSSFSISIVTTKSDGWNLARGEGTIIASTKPENANQQVANNFTVRYAATDSGYTGKAWINNWAYETKTLERTDSSSELLTTLGTTISIVSNVNPKKVVVNTAGGQFDSVDLVSDTNTPNSYNYSRLSNMGAGLSDYSTVTTNIAVTKAATNGVLTVNNATIYDQTTVSDGVTLTLNNVTLQAGISGSASLSGTVNVVDLSFTETDRDRTSGNGFGTVSGSVDSSPFIGSGVTTTGVTAWQVNGYTATRSDAGVLSVAEAPSRTYFYYTAEAVNTSTIAGAKALVVDTQNTTNAVALGNSQLQIDSLTIRSGLVTTTNNAGEGCIKGGSINIEAGGIFRVTGGHDAFGYNADVCTSSITLTGAAGEGNLAVLDLQQNTTHSVTMKTNIVMNGYASITGAKGFNTYGCSLTVSGTNNLIERLDVRTNATLTLNTGADLTIGAMTEGVDGGKRLSVSGDGALTVSSGSFSGSISGNVLLTKAGSGNLNLNVTNTSAAGVNITGGTLTVKSATSLGSGSIALSNGAKLLLDFNGGLGSSTQHATVTMSDGTGIVFRNGGGGAAPNAYANITASGEVYLAGSIYGNNTRLNGSITGATEGSNTLVLKRNGDDANAWTLASKLSGNLALKMEANTVTLTNTESDFIGGTIISGGVLKLASGASLGSGSVEVQQGGKLDLSATVTLANDLALQEGATLGMGSAVALADHTLTLNKGVTLSGNFLTSLTGADEDTVVTLFSGVDNFTTNATALTTGDYKAADIFTNPELIDTADYVYTVNFADHTVTLSKITVPEPTSTTLSLLALTALAARRRR